MTKDELQRWLQEQLPPKLLGDAPEITIYEDEIVIMLPIAGGTGDPTPGAEPGHTEALQQIAQLREQTRPLRMRLARELQAMLGLPVGWGMRLGGTSALFTTRTTPVMTRLGRAERDVLDTLVAAGVADTRSAALAYTVRAFALEHSEWLSEVRAAIEQVEQVRARLKLSRRAGVPASAAEGEGAEG